MISIRWPSNASSKFENVTADQILFIDEKKGIVRRRPLRAR